MRKTKTTKKYAGLVKRGGVYYADWAFDGKRYRVSTGTGDKDEAAAIRRKILDNFAGEHKTAAVLSSVKDSLQRASRRTLSVKDAWTTHENDVETRQVAPTTRSVYAGRAESFAKWAEARGVRNVDDVTLPVAREYMASICAGMAGKTFNDHLAILSQIWNTLVRAGYTDVNPWKLVTRRDKDTHVKSELDMEQLDALFLATDGNPEMRLLFTIGIYTGLRLEDCATLEWPEVDLRARFIRTKPDKTRRHNIVVAIPIVQPLHDALSAAWDGGDGFVLPRLAERYRRNTSGRNAVSRLAMEVFEKAGIVTRSHVDGRTRAATDYGFHSLRHTFVSLAARYGIPQPIVQSIVGHTNAAMTLHYTHTTPEQLTRAMSAFPTIGVRSLPEQAFEARVGAFLDGLDRDQLRAVIEAAEARLCTI